MIDYANETIDPTIDDAGIDFENYDLNELVNEVYKETHPVGHQIVVRIFKPKIETKTKGGLILTAANIKSQHEDHKFINFVGLVVKMARACYQDKSLYELTGPYCKVGDWVMFTRSSAYTYSHKGITTATITEHKILQVVDDPRVISRISYE